MQADLWLSNGTRLQLDEALIVGNTIQRLTASPKIERYDSVETYDRQIRMFGKLGQFQLAHSCVGIIGLGGIGSLLAEYLARLGVEHYYLIDDDVVKNLIYHASLGRLSPMLKKPFLK